VALHDFVDLKHEPRPKSPVGGDPPKVLPRITAVVLNWCGETVTTECLRSLQRSEYQDLTVLLVDNGSPDGSGDRLRATFPDVDFLQTGRNLGYAGGNNRGIEWALDRGADYVLIANNDTVVEPRCVGALARTAVGGDNVGGTAPKILRHDAPDRIWYAGGDFSWLLGLGTHRTEGEWDDPAQDDAAADASFMTGCCCLLSAEALRQIGGFDEAYFAYVEDADLSLRMKKGGFRMLYQPNARVLHHCPSPGTSPTPFQIRHRDRNRRRVMRRHFGLTRRLPFRLRFVVTRMLLLAKYLSARDQPRARAILDGMFGS